MWCSRKREKRMYSTDARQREPMSTKTREKNRLWKITGTRCCAYTVLRFCGSVFQFNTKLATCKQHEILNRIELEKH